MPTETRKRHRRRLVRNLRRVESLEERVLLSAFGPHRQAQEAVLVHWGGVEALAKPDEYIIRIDGLAGTPARQTEAFRQLLGSVGQDAQVQHLGLNGMFQIQVDPGVDHEDLHNVLKGKGKAYYLEPNFVGEWSVSPNDPRFGSLWGLNNTGQVIGGISGTPRRGH